MIARILFEPRDLWVGVYVKEPWWESGLRAYAVYICILPMFPMLISWMRPATYKELHP